MRAVQPPLITRAALIRKSDPWVLAATSGAITLEPLWPNRSPDRGSMPDECMFLNLTFLGHFEGRHMGGRPERSAPQITSAKCVPLVRSIELAIDSVVATQSAPEPTPESTVVINSTGIHWKPRRLESATTSLSTGWLCRPKREYR